MIDGNPNTRFAFAPNDPAPTVIVEFADAANIDRVNATYKASGGLIDVYLLDELGQPAGDLSHGHLVQTVAADNRGQAVLDFEPRGARYVALRWRRGDGHLAANTHSSTVVDGKDGKSGLAGRGLDGREFNGGNANELTGNSRHGGSVDLGADERDNSAVITGASRNESSATAEIGGDNAPGAAAVAAPRGDTIEIAEIGAIADVPLGFLNANQAPELYAVNSSLPPINGEGGPDFSNRLGTLADPPVLAEVSP
jgi:hypothetical protein